MKKIFLLIQIIASAAALSSKYFLAEHEIIGWWLSTFAYVLIAYYNYKKNDLITYTLLVVGLALLSVYGGIKWLSGIYGLQWFDYLVVSSVVVFAIYLTVKLMKKKKPLLQVQLFGTLVFMTAFLLLGFNMSLGWVFMIGGHLTTGYIYALKKDFIFVIIQLLSIYIALAALTSLPMPF